MKKKWLVTYLDSRESEVIEADFVRSEDSVIAFASSDKGQFLWVSQSVVDTIKEKIDE